jgi:hypothetical protein
MTPKDTVFGNSPTTHKLPFRISIFSFPTELNSRSLSEFEEMDENLVEDIVSSLDPDLIPWNYIDLAFVTGLDGIEREVHGSELYSLLNHPAIDTVALSVQVLMDRKRLMFDISTAISDFWDDILYGGTIDDNDKE